MAFATEFKTKADFRDDIVAYGICFLVIFQNSSIFQKYLVISLKQVKRNSGSKSRGLVSASIGGQHCIGQKT